MVNIAGNRPALYSVYMLGILTVSYILGELGHFLLGVTSKQMAIDLDYGDRSCQLNNSQLTRVQLPLPCQAVSNKSAYVQCTLE